ncbi:MAG: putative ABC transporter permease subunit [Bacillota bacterium]
MRRALKVTAIHLKLVLRSMHAVMWLVIPLVSALVVASVYSMFRGIASLELFLSPRDLAPAISGVLNALFLVLLSSSFGAAFTYLYLAKDMGLLLASPLRPRYVILSKVLEVSLLGSAPFLLVGLPMLAGLGTAWYARPWFYPLAFVASIPLAVFPALLAIMLNLIVSRLIPPHRTRELLAATSTLLGGIIYLILRFAGASARTALSHDQLAALLGRWGPSWSPTTLLADSIAEGLLDKPLPLALSAGLMILACAAAFALVVPWTERAYVSGWASYGEAKGAARYHSGQRGARKPLPKSVARAETGRDARPAGTWRSGATTAALSLKVESRLLFRDLQAQSQALYFVIMVMAWVIFPSRGDGPSVAAPWVTLAAFFSLSGTYSSWSLRTAAPTSRILRAAPADPSWVMAGKACFYGVVQSVILVTILTLMSATGKAPAPSPWFLLIAVALSFSTAAVTVAGIASNPNTATETGVPRIAFGTGLVIVLINTLLAVTGIVASMLIEKTRPSSLGGAAGIALVFLAVQFAAFRSAMQLFRRYVLGTGQTEGGAS